MSADNVITILSTPAANGKRAYRVAEHGDSGSPIRHYCDGEDGPFKSQVTDADYAVRIFADAPVFEERQAAYAEAARLEEDAGYVEYGISSADIDETWEQLLEKALALRERRKSCLIHQEHLNMADEEDPRMDWMWPNYLLQHLQSRGWKLEEALVAQAHLQQTYDREDEYQYAGDLRLARLANAEEMAVFAAISAKGCCGFHEEELVVQLPDGASSRIMVGFNYGH